MHGEGGINCDFCDLDGFRNADWFIESQFTFYAADAINSSQVLPGSGIICPFAHRETPFEMSPEEWADIRTLLHRVKPALDQRLRPDGYNLIWNGRQTLVKRWPTSTFT